MKMPARRSIDVGADSRSREPDERLMEPLWHLEDRGDHFMIGADLPFVRKEDVSIFAWNRNLEIRARTKNHSSGTSLSFHAVVTLPCDIVTDRICARFLKQILEIEVPKSIAGKKQVEIE